MSAVPVTPSRSPGSVSPSAGLISPVPLRSLASSSSTADLSSLDILTSRTRYTRLAAAASALPHFSSPSFGVSSLVAEENRRRLQHSQSLPTLQSGSSKSNASISSSDVLSSVGSLSSPLDRLFHQVNGMLLTINPAAAIGLNNGKEQKEKDKEDIHAVTSSPSLDDSKKDRRGSVRVSGRPESAASDSDKRSTTGVYKSLQSKLNVYRHDAEARDALERRVLQLREAKIRVRVSATLDGRSSVEKNKALAALYTSEYLNRLRKEVHEREKEKERQARERKLAHELDLLRASEERSREYLEESSPELLRKIQQQREELLRTKKFQLAWLMMIKLAPLTAALAGRLRSIIAERVERETAEFFALRIDSIYYNSLTWQQFQRREGARSVIERSLLRYARRWKFRRQRAAALEIWKLLTLVKAAQSIRQGLKDSSVRSQIVKLQNWWRRVMKGIRAQRSLVEVKWLRREHYIARQTAKRNHERRKSMSGNTALFGNIGGIPVTVPVPLPVTAPMQGRRGSIAAGGDSSPVRGAKKASRGIDLDMSAYKPVPKSYRRETIAQLVAHRRALHRSKLRVHFKEVQRFHQLHSHEIELARARLDLGMRTEWMKIPKEPEAPRMIHIPPNEELDAAIEAASKSFYLTKLQTKLNENDQKH